MKYSFSALLLSAFIAGMICFNTADAAEDKPLSKADVEAIIKQVINDNPELIIGSVQNYQRKKEADNVSKASKAIVERQADLINDSGSPSVGSPNANVTIVEFFDYHCGYCKQFLPTVTQLLGEDKNLRLVFKEFPILSEDSDLAAKAALAVNSIDKTKYLAFHTALMKMSTTFTNENLTAKAKEIGIGETDFKKAMASPDLDKQLTKNRELAYALNIHGTPAIIVGKELVPGVIPVNDLKARIAAIREGK